MAISTETRELLSGIMRAALRRNVRASDKEALEAFRDERRKNPKAIAALEEYYFHLNRKNWDTEEIGIGQSVVAPKPPQSRPEKSPEGKAKVAEGSKQRIAGWIAAARTLVLMDLVLIDGTRVRDAKITNLSKHGGWVADLIKGMKPGQTVSNAYTEEELHNIQARKLGLPEIVKSPIHARRGRPPNVESRASV